MRGKFIISTRLSKPRQGVPVTLAPRWVTRAVRPKKGAGSYSRKGRKASPA